MSKIEELFFKVGQADALIYGKQLEARIAELERRNVLITEKAQAVVARWESPLWKDLPNTGNYIYALRDALSATSADYEAFIQAEIVKRLVGDYLSKVEAAFFNHDSEGKDATTDRWERRRDEWRSFKSYLLYGSPLATPEEHE